jgi:UDP-N-acetylglucosamine--dolichyl-phosphate N-acetylglucosaminephosphotransferase
MSKPSEPLITLLASVGLSYLAYRLTASLIPLLGPNLVAKGLGGMDMLKLGFKRDEELVSGREESETKLEVVQTSRML